MTQSEQASPCIPVQDVEKSREQQLALHILRMHDVRCMQIQHIELLCIACCDHCDTACIVNERSYVCLKAAAHAASLCSTDGALHVSVQQFNVLSNTLHIW